MPYRPPLSYPVPYRPPLHHSKPKLHACVWFQEARIEAEEEAALPAGHTALHIGKVSPPNSGARMAAPTVGHMWLPMGRLLERGWG